MPLHRGRALRSVNVIVAVSLPLLREGIAMALGDDADIAVVGVAAAPGEVRDAEHADALVIQVTGPESVDEVLQVRAAAPDARIIGVHDGLPHEVLVAAQEAGVAVLVDVTAGEAAVVDAVRGTRDRTLRRWERPRVGMPPLTEREHTVLTCVAAGDSSREIAERLHISIHTVENVKQRLFRKLGVSNQAQAVATALRHGLLGLRSVEHIS